MMGVCVALGVFSVMLTAALCDDSCNVWFHTDKQLNDSCVCSPDIEGYISCSQDQNVSWLHLGKAIGIDNHTIETVVAHIPYIYPPNAVNSTHLKIMMNRSIEEQREHLCEQLHRTFSHNHTYCGQCNKVFGYGPAIYSYGIRCAECSKVTGSLLYFALQLLPISIFYGVVLVFGVDLTRPNMFHYIVFCNSVTFMFRYSAGLIMNYLYTSGFMLQFMMKVGLTLSGVWSLDFLRFVVPPFCFATTLHDCVVPFFDFFPVVYLLIVTAIISIFVKLHVYKIRVVLFVWKPFQRLLEIFKLNRNPVEAVTHTYATFFFLYLYKTMSVAFITSLTSPAFTQAQKTTERLTVYYDPTAKYFEGHHVAVIMVSFTVATVLILPALILLTFFRSSGIQRFYHSQFNQQSQLIIRTFVQTLENGYRDGSNGTRDLRPVSGMFFLLLITGTGIIIALLRRVKYSDNVPWPLATAGYVLLAVLYGTLRPYKKRSDNNMAVFMYSILVVISNLISFTQQRSEVHFYLIQHKVFLFLIMAMIITVNIIYCVYIAHKVFNYFRIYRRMRSMARNVCNVFRCPCARYMREEEEERLLSQQGVPTYYQ